jgi:hypothetical protein
VTSKPDLEETVIMNILWPSDCYVSADTELDGSVFLLLA